MLLLLITLLLLPFAPRMAGAQSLLLTPESRRDLELQPGVVLIHVQFKATLGPWTVTPSVLGTGFLYRPDGYLITNGHVAQLANEKDPKAMLERRESARPLLIDAVLASLEEKLGRPVTAQEREEFKAKIKELIDQGALKVEDMKLTVHLSNGDSYLGEIKAYSDPIDENGKDIAIIKIDAKNLPTVPLGNSDEVNVGDPLTVVGFPGESTRASLLGLLSKRSALVATVTNGRVSAVNKSDYKGTPVIQSEAIINPGNSGGPAFDGNGRAIGVATYMLNRAESSTTGLNFFVPINTAMEFVRQAGAEPERGEFDKIWSAALEAYSQKHWYKAHELMGSALELQPDQPDAVKLQLAAAQNMHAEGFVGYWVDRLGVLGLGVVLGVVVLVVVAIILFVVLSKPKSARQPLPVATQVAVVAQPELKAAPVIEGESFGTLYINNGPLAGNRFVIPKKGLLIGRDPSMCTVVLPDETVSKEHAWVVPLDNGVAVIDRSSVNGTYLNSTESQRISKIVLANNDRIYIGRKNPTEITYFSA